MAKQVRAGLSFAEAGALGVALARMSTVARATDRELTQDMVDRLGQHLAMKQLDWQANRSDGLDPKLLAEQLNTHLDLASGPDYLRVRPEHIERMRLDIWSRLPELSTALEPKDVMPGVPLFPTSMSPLEAYVAADWAVASKILNPAEFSRTDAEEKVARLAPPQVPPVGLQVVQPSPRVEAFLNHLRRVAVKKWREVDSAMLSVSDVMEKSRRR